MTPAESTLIARGGSPEKKVPIVLSPRQGPTYRAAKTTAAPSGAMYVQPRLDSGLPPRATNDGPYRGENTAEIAKVSAIER